MADRHSALAAVAASNASSSHTTLREVRPGSIVQIVAWPDTLPSVHRVIGDLLRIDVPPIGRSAGDSATTLLAAGPGRFLAISMGEDLSARLEPALPSSDGAITDLSHGRALLRLEGSGAAATLGRCIALDLDVRVFPPGRVAQTAIHHVDVTILRRGEHAFELLVLRGFAESLAEWLLDAGLEFGVAFAR